MLMRMQGQKNKQTELNNGHLNVLLFSWALLSDFHMEYGQKLCSADVLSTTAGEFSSPVALGTSISGMCC